ncbi:unnamed protein product [Microthlaspi erraticum]|uniref:F-box domain-containing protein n=1 Tax=Microthlaspi erraticum TaxID=1685480 RepID=A0A6D2K315_9BRAS|nr:unnamed protein product [Microthlaspi erraticum]
MKKGKQSNWAELPPELTFSILLRLSVAERLKNAQRVCRSWRGVCKDPLMWRKINMTYLEDIGYDFEAMCCHAVDRSQGGLLEIKIEGFGSDSLLTYIANRSSNLRLLKIPVCNPMWPSRLVKAAGKLPLLEELEIPQCWWKMNLKALGYSCPRLKTLKLNCLGYGRSPEKWDVDALSIAESMPELRHLQLLGNCLTDVGVNAILDGCPHLEHLGLRKPGNVNFDGNLEKRCSERIRDLRHPNDSIADYTFDSTFSDDDSEGIIDSGGEL